MRGSVLRAVRPGWGRSWLFLSTAAISLLLAGGFSFYLGGLAGQATAACFGL